MEQFSDIESTVRFDLSPMTTYSTAKSWKIVIYQLSKKIQIFGVQTDIFGQKRKVGVTFFHSCNTNNRRTITVYTL